MHITLRDNAHDAHSKKVKEGPARSPLPTIQSAASQSEHLRAALEERDAYRARIPEARRLVNGSVRNAKDLTLDKSGNAILEHLDGTEPCEPASDLNPRD